MPDIDLTAILGLSEAFLKNLALLIVLAYLLSLLRSPWNEGTSIGRQLVIGVIFAAATVACMNMPLEPRPGLLLDQRGLILLFAGPFGGPWAAVVAAVIAGLYRVYLGGIGMWAGLGAMVTTLLLSLVMIRHLGQLRRPGSAAIGGLLLTCMVIPWFFAVGGWDLGLSLIGKFGLAYPIFYVCGAIFLSGILMVDRRRRESEFLLSESETKLRDVLDVSTDWFWESDAAHRFSYLSESFSEVFSRDRSAYIGRKRSDFAMEEDLPRVRKHEEMLDRREPFVDFTYALTAADGRTRHVSISGKPVFDASGEFVGYRGSGREVSERVEARNKLEQALMRAEDANRAKARFLSQMSHELRTPLNAVIGFSDLIRMELRGPIGNKAYKEDAEGIYESGHHLLGLINDLLDLSKLEAGKLVLSDDRCNLCEVAEAAVRMVRPRAETAGVELLLECGEGDLEAVLDERAIRQVALNLLTNAIKFTARGGQVRLSVDRAAHDSLRLIFSDTGVGIPKAEQSKVFAPFERAEHARDSLIEGTGLGLSICKALIEAHGGTIGLESEPGKGTTITVTLPDRREEVTQGRSAAAA